MSSHTTTVDLFTASSDITRSYRGWIIFAGVTLLVLGAAAIVYDGIATLASVAVFGWLLMLAGFMQIAHAFQVRAWSGFFLYLLDGIIRATVGLLLMLYPGSGAQALTLVVSFYFIVGGLFKTFGSAALRFPSWGWSVASGLVSALLGVMLLMQWPVSGMWFIGFAVGLDLLLYGWALLMFAAAVQKQSLAVVAATLAIAIMGAGSPQARSNDADNTTLADAAAQSVKGVVIKPADDLNKPAARSRVFSSGTGACCD